METTPYVIRLSLEEVVYLMYAAHVTSLPGLAQPPLGPLDGDHQALALATADRALRARSLLKWTGPETRTLDPTIAGLINSYAHAPLRVTLTRTRDQRSATQFITFDAQFMIDHVEIEQGVHQFCVTNTAADARERLFDLLTFQGSVGRGMAGTITAQQWESITMHLADSQAIVAAISNQIPNATAQGIASSLASGILFTLTLQDNGKAMSRRLSIIDGQAGSYLVALQGEDYQLAPTHLEQLKQVLLDFFQPALQQIKSR